MSSESEQKVSPPSPLLALVLTGVAPGTGHLHAGRAGRGIAGTGALGGACVVWAAVAGTGWRTAVLLLLLPVAVAIWLLADAVCCARSSRAPWEALRPWRRRLAMAVVGLLSVVGLPAVVLGVLGQTTALVRATDAHMEPAVHEHERVVVDSWWWRHGEPLALGEIVAVPVGKAAQVVALRRVVGLPGSAVTVVRGRVFHEGRRWASDPARPQGGSGSFRGEARVGAREVLVLSDGRASGEEDSWVVPLDAVIGRASYVLLPALADLTRVGRSLR